MIRFFRYKGFTLAEILITLGIIGIIAALTIPNIVTNYQKEETVTRLKKIYTILNQAVLLSETDNGSVENWTKNSNVQTVFTKYLQPYIHNIKSVSYNPTYMPTYKRLNGTIENTFNPLSWSAGIVTLNDGSVLYLSPSQVDSTSSFIWVFVDINGFKGPNIIGKDFFGFSIPLDSSLPKVVPYGTFGFADMPMGDWTKENTKKGSYACSKQGRGQFCAALIIIDGWKISNDYPW